MSVKSGIKISSTFTLEEIETILGNEVVIQGSLGETGLNPIATFQTPFEGSARTLVVTIDLVDDDAYAAILEEREKARNEKRPTRGRSKTVKKELETEEPSLDSEFKD